MTDSSWALDSFKLLMCVYFKVKLGPVVPEAALSVGTDPASALLPY